MINSINSYSNYTDLNFSNSRLNTNSPHQNLVKNKSEAVSQILGYGVDSEGFFTSDFNEQAGIAKEYKIYAKGVENFVYQQQNSASLLTTHTRIDIAKSIGNLYKVFSQLVPNTQNSSFTQDEINNLPIAFSVDKNFNIKQTYTYAEYRHLSDAQRGQLFTSFDILSNPSYTALNIFESQFGANIGANAYKNTDGSVEKGGVFMAFVNNSLFGITRHLLVGETNVLGKIAGLSADINQSEINELKAFMNANKIKSAFLNSSLSASLSGQWNIVEDRLSLSFYVKDAVENKLGAELVEMAKKLQAEYNELMNSNLNLNEFKEKYLQFKEKHDEFVKQFDEAMNQLALNGKKQTSNNAIFLNQGLPTAEQGTSLHNPNEEKNFTPLQVISKSQTYKDLNSFTMNNLLQDQYKLNMFEILFGKNTIKTSINIRA